eukprot:6291117-Pyramimonas_sp.AAC.1
MSAHVLGSYPSMATHGNHMPYCWLVPTDANRCWLVPTDANRRRSAPIDAKSMLQRRYIEDEYAPSHRQPAANA